MFNVLPKNLSYKNGGDGGSEQNGGDGGGGG